MRPSPSFPLGTCSQQRGLRLRDATFMASHFPHRDAMDPFSFWCAHLIHSIRINKNFK